MASADNLLWSSHHSGWHNASTPSNKPFTPTPESLVFGELLNSQVEPDGFIVAFFKPDIAIDSLGRVLCVPAHYFNPIVGLAKDTLALPQTGSFRNTWRVKHDRTDQPIRSLLVHQGGASKETSVYGYEKGNGALDPAVGGVTQLPAVLMELFGLLDEAREGYVKGKEDSNLIAAVKAVIPEPNN